jgi:hypothetical protein
MFNVPSFFGFKSGGGIPLLLDTYSGAAAAYSLRGLSTPYVNGANPYACQVRNSSNVPLNIGFVFNSLTGEYELDTAALLAHCGGGNGFVDVWYDQSGNVFDATQVIALNQPQIVSAGSVLTLAGIGSAKPILRFDGINDSLDLSGISVTVFTSFYPQKKSVNADLSAWFANGPAPSTPYTPIIFGASGIYIANNVLSTNDATYNNNNYILMSGYINSANNGFIQINNSSLTLPSTFTGGGSATLNSINKRASSFSKCDVPEMILYATDNSANISAINTNINTYYGIY